MTTRPAFDLHTFLTDERARVDAALERAMARLAATFPPDLLPAARHAALSGGKRLRPILCVAAYRACASSRPAATDSRTDGMEEEDLALLGASRERSDSDAVYDLGCSLELIHAYSLMHDDLPCMDDAELRRGQPTPHTLFGEVTSMRAGAALIPAAGLQAWWGCQEMEVDPDVAERIVRELMQAAGAGGMVGGQVLDLVGEGEALGPVQLDGLHRRKTGALLRAALLIGGLAAGADARTLDALGQYGRAVGLAFQIADDVLDATASADTLGKKPSDQELDKSTYVALYGLDEARNRATQQSRSGRQALAAAGLDSPVLDGLARYIVERSH